MLSSLLAIGIVAVVIGTSGSRPTTTDARASAAVSAGVTVTVPPAGTAQLDVTDGARATNDVTGVSDGADSAAGIGDGVDEDTTPWPPPPADPTPAVTTAVAQADAAGVQQAVVIMDRTTGTILEGRSLRAPSTRPAPTRPSGPRSGR